MIKIILSIAVIAILFTGCVGTIADAGTTTGTKAKNVLVKGVKDAKNVVIDDVNRTKQELLK